MVTAARRPAARCRAGGALGPALAVLLMGTAAAEPPSMSALIEAADISGVAASPDGRLVAFRVDRPSIERNSYALGWHVVDVSTGRVRPIAEGGEPIIADPGLLVAEPPIWSPDGRWIYYRALRSGAVQLWRASADGTGAEAMSSEDGDVLSFELTPGRHSILYRVGPARSAIERAELAEYDSGILIDEHVELAQNVFRGALVNGRRASQRLSGPWFGRGNVLWREAPRLRRLDLDILQSSNALEEPAAGLPSVPDGAWREATARSARGDIAFSYWDGGQGSLVVVRPGAAGARIQCPIAECVNERVAWAAWRPGHDEVLFANSDASLVQSLRLWDLASGRVRLVTRGDGLLAGGRDDNSPCAFAGRHAFCVRAEPASPPRLEAIDLDSGRARSLFDPNARLRSLRWPRTERLSWSADGRRFTGILFLPDGAAAGPVPLFVNYYRCRGFVRGGVGDEWPFAILAANGIASVCVNATRSSGAQNGVEQYRAAASGIEALIGQLTNRGLVDRRRVGMGGLSFGTEVTLWTLIHSDLIAAASIASPQFEPASYWFNGVRGRDYHRGLRDVWGLGAPEETPEQWRLLSAAMNVERIRAPLLLQLAEQESRYAIELHARLTNSTTPAELHVFPEEPHIKVQPRHRLAVYRRNLDWFSFWLLGREDPDPAKAEQYRRWRALAERFREADQPRRAASHSSSETRSNTR